ncbi:MAG: pyrroloquinoline quinone precursor peptide PqqA [Gemmatimonadetes bacterium]|nr:MAG: pyrroloquinoline quinone precursor peptide PqqA [Gemmatimonadota bacterium]
MLRREGVTRLGRGLACSHSGWHGACLGKLAVEWSTTTSIGGCNMSWTKPEFEVVELGMEVGAYAGNA